MAEVLLRERGGDRFEAYSAGTERSAVRPLTLRVLSEAGLPTEGLTSISTDEVIEQRFDWVITVCDDAREVCPTFPGEGRRLHWSFKDPSAATGGEAERLAAFRGVFAAISDRIDDFLQM